MNLLDIPEEIQDDIRVALERQDFERAVELVAIAAKVAKPRSHFELLIDLAHYGLQDTNWGVDITSKINLLKGDISDMLVANNFSGISKLALDLEQLVLRAEEPSDGLRICLTRLASRMGEKQFTLWIELLLDGRDT